MVSVGLLYTCAKESSLCRSLSGKRCIHLRDPQGSLALNFGMIFVAHIVCQGHERYSCYSVWVGYNV